MSSILKALRRHEEDRARKKDVAPDIAASLLRDGGRRRSNSLIIAMIVIAFIMTVALGLFVFWFWSSVPAKSDSVQLMPAPALPPAQRFVDALPERGRGIIIEEVIAQRRPALPPMTPPAVSTAVSQPVKLSSPTVQSAPQEVPSPSVDIKSVITALEERQSPVITAIAWQDDSAARMAVVDGLPVMTGEAVGAAKVVEILQDRVLFAEDGVRFFVALPPQ